MILKLFKNQIVGYISSRYVTYGIQFFNSLLIASLLGPFYLGIWGFINLSVNYLLQMNFGIAHSVNTISSVNKHHDQYISKIIGNSIIILGFLSCLISILFLFSYFFAWEIGSKYHFSKYMFFVLIIVITGYYSSLFSMIFRIYGRLWEIAFSQSMFPFITFIILLLFKTDILLSILIWAYCLSNLIALSVFIFRFPIKIKINYSKRIWWIIQKKGWYLFLYNTSFTLIILSTRTFISHYYEVQEFGYFTFAFSLANVILLLLNSFTYLIWPKLLNSFSKSKNHEAQNILNRVRGIYITTSHLLVHIAILFFPVFLSFFPEYHQSSTVFAFIALTIVLFTNSFGYQGLLIAKGKEKSIGLISLGALMLNILLCYFIIVILNLSFSFVIFSTMISYVFYIYIIGHLGRDFLGFSIKPFDVFKDIFPSNIMIPFITSIMLLVFRANDLFLITPLLLYIILNIKSFKLVNLSVREIILNPKKINF